jgi:hypothetical protein
MLVETRQTTKDMEMSDMQQGTDSNINVLKKQANHVFSVLQQ